MEVDVIEKLMTSRFKNECITIRDIAENPDVPDEIKKLFPEVKIEGKNLFVKTRDDLFGKDTLRSALYFVSSTKGVLLNEADLSFCQTPPSCKGFITRISAPTNQIMPHMLTMDYTIDMSKIWFNFDSNLSNINGEIVQERSATIKSIEFSDYPNVEWNDYIGKFDNKREEICRIFF